MSIVIVADSREQKPLDFTRWTDVTVEVGTLTTGDYALKTLETRAACERKNLDDLVGSLSTGRERFEAELTRARGFDLFVIVAECSMQDVAEHKYRSRMTPESVLQSLFAYQCRYGVPTIWAGSREGAAYVVRSILAKYLREHIEGLRAILRAHDSEAA